MVEHKHINRLKNETSPYLLQHAHNPVDWYPWNEEALTRARAENKPIMLSIGYSACHWCHVMERESFENEEIARLMNVNFINIKVDREERPDLDQIYMNAVQMMTSHGGWPLTVFLTPDLIPFFGGTYFPPEDRYQIPGFPRVLIGVAEAYRTRTAEVQQTSREILAELQNMGAARLSAEALSPSMLDTALRDISRRYDSTYGGFGGAPKFPAPMNLEFALRTHYRTGEDATLEIVTHTCHRMAEGGMYDQLGGGFHRYSTDARWLVPHFEKMLYDNALLSRLYLHVYQLTGDEFFRRVVEETLDYVVREMTDPQSGGFYSTQDADSEGVEGKFFVWTIDEIKRLLGEEDGALVGAYYDASEEGNFEDSNILHVPQSEGQVAHKAGVPLERLMKAVERGRRVLFEARERRIKPARDEKVLTAWNGMMLESFAEASAVLERADHRIVAERNAEFLLTHLRRDGLLLHTYKDGQAKYHGYLDDYAHIASGLVTLYEVTGEIRWLEEAQTLTERMIEEFWDEDGGGFFYTGNSGEQLIVRTKDYLDNATPSGNSVAAELLLRLAILTDNQDYRLKATMIFRLAQNQTARYPSAFGYLLGALDFYLSAPQEIVIIGERGSAEAQSLAREVWSRYLPNRVIAQSTASDQRARSLVPLLRDRSARQGLATAYVCENYACQQPVTTAEELASQIIRTTDRRASGVS